MRTWRVRRGGDRRLRAGHPWVFSNELTESPKGHEPGAPVRLEDEKGAFLALGYGNPHSLIAFRALSFDAAVVDPVAENFLHEKLLQALKSRLDLGYTASFRWCYGEGDFFSGLVLDRYLVQLPNGSQGQVLAFQILSAGVSRAIPEPLQFFERLVKKITENQLLAISWEQTAVVQRNDVNVRKLEGLTYENSKVLKEISSLDLSKADVVLHSAVNWQPNVLVRCDLIEGQKTGFFLDQSFNIQVLCKILSQARFSAEPVRILDLCCYNGQWSTQLTQVLKSRGLEVQVTCVDVSEPALQMAAFNAERAGAKVETLKMDVLEDLPRLADRSYDIVIADPPAFIKAKKDVPTGSHAYLKMNTHAVRLTKSGGLVASCSCSANFTEEMMVEVLAKAVRRDGRQARCVAHGGHATDHPVLIGFPEGFYLKMFVHQISDR